MKIQSFSRAASTGPGSVVAGMAVVVSLLVVVVVVIVVVVTFMIQSGILRKSQPSDRNFSSQPD